MAVNHAQTRSGPDFGASLPDLRWIDRERAGLFTLIGQMRGAFSSVRRWPWMDRCLSAPVSDDPGPQRRAAMARTGRPVR